MTSSIEPEIRDISQQRQRRTEPRPQVTCVNNLVKIGQECWRYAGRQTRLSPTPISKGQRESINIIIIIIIIIIINKFV